MIIAILLTGAVVVIFAFMHYRTGKAALLLRGELVARQSVEDLERYIMINEDSLIRAAYAVNNMLLNESSSEEILAFLVIESNWMSETLYEDFAGLYGYINGNYLDGTGWIPDDDYDPITRPWYIMAREHPGELVFVDPYPDVKTNTKMMTLAACLDDGESVVALDVSLNNMQTIVEQISEMLPGSECMVLDSRGSVAAHSVIQEIGHNYQEEQDSLGHFIVQKIYQEQESQFEVGFEDNTFVVYSQEIEGQWYCISVIDAAEIYEPLRTVLIIAICMAALLISIVIIVFIRVGRRNIKTNDLNIQLSTIADIYSTILDIDLEGNTFEEIVNKENLPMDIQNKMNAQESMIKASQSRANDLSKGVLRSFLDFSTLRDRIGDRKSIAIEFLDNEHGWCRGRFMVAEKNSKGNIIRVLWTVENIDEEKKHREYLTWLAERDQMTGLFNRASAERKIDESLSQGCGGMFMMLDIDSFKNINDRFGHRAGDQVIVKVAGCLRNAFRNQDIVFRHRVRRPCFRSCHRGLPSWHDY